MAETTLGRMSSSLALALGSEPSEVAFTGRPGLLPSVYAVSDFASATVALATTAVASVLARRTGQRAPRAFVDHGHVAAAFRSERYLQAIGWKLPPVWDPIAGDYETEDGFVRLHTNYRWHRDAVLRVLGVPESRDAVTAAARAWAGDALESAVVAEGGAAAFLRTEREFSAHPAGSAIAREPLFAWSRRRAAPLALGAGNGAPLAGVRVLDLTRVIAGPVCTRFLAAYGASVLRIDPPGFEEVPALLSETTAGKRRAALDLRDSAARGAFERAVREAHVLVTGYRSDALERLGFGEASRRALNPALVTISLDAYGWTGPWSTRRGFDSLVQMSCGIAARGRDAMGGRKPFPLPAQALDHGTGYLAAAAACRALAERLETGEVCDARLSLARTARFLQEFGDDFDPRAPEFEDGDAEPYRETAETPWGAVRRVRCPGAIDGFSPGWTLPPGPLGVDAPHFTD